MIKIVGMFMSASIDMSCQLSLKCSCKPIISC